MDVVSEIEVIESDVRDVEQKCQKVNCSAIYDAIIASLKLLHALIFVCTKKKSCILKQLQKHLLNYPM